MKKIEIYIDGASSGNPGPSGIGFVIYEDGKTVKEISRAIGQATNNIAEYSALIHALEEAQKIGAKEVLIKTDSELLYKQLKGEYRVKNENIAGLFQRSMKLISAFSLVRLEYTTRENNRAADKLAKKAINPARKNTNLIFS